MKDQSQLDYIVIGQGLAGSAVAFHLLTLGKKILVIDEPLQNTSSRIAAGLFNPVTGQNNVRTWMAETLFHYLDEYYRDVETKTGRQFYYPKNIYRPFLTIEEQNEWMGRSTDPGYNTFIDKIFLKSTFPETHDALGGILLKKGGFVNTRVYIEAVRHYLQDRRCLRDEIFEEDKLEVKPEGVVYDDCRARYIIFCQGVRALQNKFFKKFPVRPLKGETLTIKSEFSKDVILNRGVYMVPDSVPGQFRVGATYNLKDTRDGVSPEGKRELEEKLRQLLNESFEITGADWGLRPTTTDRRPLLGQHPEHERLIIFNGLGTKGVSLAPYFSNVLICWLEKTGILPPEVVLTRYK